MQVSDLTPAGYNPRKITKHRKKALDSSMKEFGDLSGIVFNRRSGNLVSGHQRMKVIPPEAVIEKEACSYETETVALGTIRMPDGTVHHYREVDWDDTKEKAANITANREFGEYDIPKLDEVLKSVQMPDMGSILGSLEADEPEFPVFAEEDAQDEADVYHKATAFGVDHASEEGDKTVTSVVFNFGGKLTFKILKDDYENWEDSVKKEVGYAKGAFTSEIVKRLGMEEYVNS